MNILNQARNENEWKVVIYMEDVIPRGIVELTPRWRAAGKSLANLVEMPDEFNLKFIHCVEQRLSTYKESWVHLEFKFTNEKSEVE